MPTNPIPDPRELFPKFATVLAAYRFVFKATWVLLIFPLPLGELFVRRGFGAARLGNFSWLNAVVLALLAWLMIGVIAAFYPARPPTGWTVIFLILVVLFSLWHEWTHHRQRRATPHAITAEPPVTYEGVPWLAWILKRPWLAAPSMLIIEPMLFGFLLPWMFRAVDPVLATLLRWLGISLLVGGLRVFSERHRIGETVGDWAGEVMRARGRI